MLSQCKTYCDAKYTVSVMPNILSGSLLKYLSLFRTNTNSLFLRSHDIIMTKILPIIKVGISHLDVESNLSDTHSLFNEAPWELLIQKKKALDLLLIATNLKAP